jgi:hypothetical protein
MLLQRPIGGGDLASVGAHADRHGGLRIGRAAQLGFISLTENLVMVGMGLWMLLQA